MPIKNPCNTRDSYAWIDPDGKIHYLPGETHAEYASMKLFGSVIWKKLDDASETFLKDGWVRVVNAKAFQAVDLHLLEKQASVVVEIVLNGAERGCVSPQTPIWYLNSYSDGGQDKVMQADAFVKWLGGRQAEERFYEIIVNRKMAKRIAHRYLTQNS